MIHSLSVIGPTRVTVSLWTPLPAVGPDRGGLPPYIWFRSWGGSASLQPPPPPGLRPVWAPPWGPPGWLRPVSDIRTCSAARRRGARRWSSHPNHERKRGLRSAARGQADQDRTMVQEKWGKSAEWQTGVRWCSGKHWTVEHQLSDQFLHLSASSLHWHSNSDMEECPATVFPACCVWWTAPSAVYCLVSVVLAVTVTRGEICACVLCAKVGTDQWTCRFCWLVGNCIDARAALNPALRFDANECRRCVLGLPKQECCCCEREALADGNCWADVLGKSAFGTGRFAVQL